MIGGPGLEGRAREDAGVPACTPLADGSSRQKSGTLSDRGAPRCSPRLNPENQLGACSRARSPAPRGPRTPRSPAPGGVTRRGVGSGAPGRPGEEPPRGRCSSASFGPSCAPGGGAPGPPGGWSPGGSVCGLGAKVGKCWPDCAAPSPCAACAPDGFAGFGFLSVPRQAGLSQHLVPGFQLDLRNPQPNSPLHFHQVKAATRLPVQANLCELAIY